MRLKIKSKKFITQAWLPFNCSDRWHQGCFSDLPELLCCSQLDKSNLHRFPWSWSFHTVLLLLTAWHTPTLSHQDSHSESRSHTDTHTHTHNTRAERRAEREGAAQAAKFHTRQKSRKNTFKTHLKHKNCFTVGHIEFIHIIPVVGWNVSMFLCSLHQG